MPIKDRTELKAEFQNGDIPDQNDFADTIDSALNLDEDGLVSYKLLTPVGEVKRFGFGGETAPDCPIGIKGEPGQDDKMICFTSNDESQKWDINLNPTSSSVTGFSIDDASSGIGSSRFFIDHVSQGNVGIGTVTPYSKLHVSGANDGGNISIMVQNEESGTDGGYLMSAVDDNAVPERMKTFALHEKISNDLTERITVLGTHGPATSPIVNVGINEVLPYATLHVTKQAADPTEPVNLAENTGILCLGQIDDNNLAMDSKNIQARHGEYVAGGPTLSFTASELCLQPYGGGLSVNCEIPAPGVQFTVASDGKVGIGATGDEKLTVNGAVTVGDTQTATPVDGTVRFGGPNADLEVWMGTMWHSLTTHTNTDGLWVEGQQGVIYYTGSAVGHPKVGIGLTTPNATLHVKETNTEVQGNSGACAIVNQAATLIADPTKSRVGLGINCTGVWSPSPEALNIGLYVQAVTGQTTVSSNIGALINGNTVIGNMTGNTIVGDDAVNVLAIQNGAAPTSTPGLTTTTGIQIYSDTVALSDGTPISAFNVMTGDGEVMKLFRQADMTAADPNTPDTGNVITNTLINNMRTRINELEAILKALGLLNP